VNLVARDLLVRIDNRLTSNKRRSRRATAE